ncbi:MAG TPA: DUF2490 domain-containing protein [Chitinophagaceae bacterium]|nr:DUF2490 domain-containing protein [Chitinophagaceae bacterium]
MKDLEIIPSEKFLKYNMITRQHIIFITLFIPAVSQGQHTTEHTNMLWEGYYNAIRFNKTWSLVSDAQVRTRNWTEKWSQLLIRSGLSYSFNDHVAVTAGFAFFKNAQYTDKQVLLKNEWRPWQEFSYQTKFKKVGFIQRLRTEQRFLQQVVNNAKTQDYECILRVRYRFDWQIPLKRNNYKLLFGNEILVNPLYINTTRFFDQNRTFAGLQFKLVSNTSLQFQYLKIFQWRSNTSVLENQNIFRLNVLQQFNF